MDQNFYNIEKYRKHFKYHPSFIKPARYCRGCKMWRECLSSQWSVIHSSRGILFRCKSCARHMRRRYISNIKGTEQHEAMKDRKRKAYILKAQSYLETHGCSLSTILKKREPLAVRRRKQRDRWTKAKAQDDFRVRRYIKESSLQKILYQFTRNNLTTKDTPIKDIANNKNFIAAYTQFILAGGRFTSNKFVKVVMDRSGGYQWSVGERRNIKPFFTSDEERRVCTNTITEYIKIQLNIINHGRTMCNGHKNFQGSQALLYAIFNKLGYIKSYNTARGSVKILQPKETMEYYATRKKPTQRSAVNKEV